MKTNWRKTLAGCIAAAVAISGACFGLAALAAEGDAPAGLTLVNGFEENEVGTALSSGPVWPDGGHAEVSDAYKGNGEKSVKLYWDAEANSVATVDLPTGHDGLIFYIKAPTAADGTAVLLDFFGYRLTDTSAYKVLTKASKAWTAQTAPGASITLPDGFEGYLWFSYDQLEKNWDGAATTGDINKVQLYATYGTADNAFYLDDVIAVDSAYDGALTFAPADYIPVKEPEKQEDPIVDIAAGLKRIEGFENTEKGDNLIPDRISQVANNTGTAVSDDTYKGNGNFAAKLWTDSLKGNSPSRIQLKPGALAGKTGIMFYIKTPLTDEPVEYGQVNGFIFSVTQSANAGGYFVKNTSVELMQAGTTEWVTVTAKDQFTDLPSGFEGYVKIPFSSLVKNWGDAAAGFADDMSKASDANLASLDNLEFYIGAMGDLLADGSENALWIDDIMVYDETYTGALDFLPEGWAERNSAGSLTPPEDDDNDNDNENDSDDDFVIPGDTDDGKEDDTPKTGVGGLGLVLLTMLGGTAGMALLKRKTR